MQVSQGVKMVVLQMNLVCESFNSLCLNSNDVGEVRSVVSQLCGLSSDQYYLTCGGRLLKEESDVNGRTVQVVPRLVGGKGGFGSMLRAIGAQIEKTTNREACRDLSGRRLRDINEEQRLKKWISQQSEREKEIEEKKKKKLEKLERVTREPAHEFKDETYEAERSDLTEKLADSVEQGFKATTSAIKRKPDEEPAKKKKKKKTILDDDFSSSDDEHEQSDEASPPQTNAKAILA